MPARTQAKQKKLGDYIDVWFKDVGDGIAAKVYRTDESDAEWEAKKAQASSRAKGTPSEWKSMPEKADPSKDEIILQGGKVRIPRGPLSDKEWADRVRTASERKDWDSYTYNGKQVTPTGKTLEDQTPEEIRANAKALAENADREVDPGTYSVKTMRADDVRPARVVPSDGNPDIKPAQVIPADSEPKGAGFSVKNPMGIIADMSKGALPATRAKAEKFADPEQQAKEDARVGAVNAAIAQGDANAAADTNSIQQLDETLRGLSPTATFIGELPGMAVKDTVDALETIDRVGGEQLNRVNDAAAAAGSYLGDKAKAVGKGILKTAMPATYGEGPGGVVNADPLDPVPPAPAAPPPVPPGGSFPGLGLPPPPSGTGSVGGALGISGSAPMPGFGYKPMLVDEKPMRDAAAAYNETTKGLLREQNAMADEHRAMAADIVQKNNEAMAVTDELTKQQIARQQTLQAEQNRMMAAYQSKMDEQERVSSQGIDPGRFWNNKSAGQKAAAVVAGALFGFTGQGMQWLQRLDGLVAEDNRLQESDLNRKIAGLDRSAKGLLTQVDFLDKTATRDNAMLEMAKAQKYKESEMYLRNFALTTQSMEMKQKALTMAEMLAGKQFEVQQNLTQLAQHNAAAVNQARAHTAAQAAEMYKFKVAQDAKGSERQGEKPTPALVEAGRRAVAGLLALPDFEKALGSGKLGDALIDQVMKNIPGSEAMNRDQQAQLMGRIIFAGIDNSVVNAADQDFLKKLQSGVGIRSMARGDVPAFKRLLEASYDSAQSTAQAYGMVTPPPLEQVIPGYKRSTSGVSAPSYMTPR